MADTGSFLKIYSQYIQTPVTFECVLPCESEFAGRVKHIMASYPYFACEDSGKILGYAYAHRHMEREAYQWNAELSVYLDRDFTSRGLGSKMYECLLEILNLQGIKTVYGGVTLPNEKSERLHESMGFNRLGTYHNTGYKCGKWHDVAWFEKAIAPYDTDPKPILPVHEVPAEKIREICERAHGTNTI